MELFNTILQGLNPKDGLFAMLFVGLFVYMIKDSREREAKYHGIIQKLTEDISNKLEHIANTMENGIRYLNKK